MQPTMRGCSMQYVGMAALVVALGSLSATAQSVSTITNTLVSDTELQLTDIQEPTGGHGQATPGRKAVTELAEDAHANAELNTEYNSDKEASPSSSASPQDAGPPAPPEQAPTKPEFDIYGAMLDMGYDAGQIDPNCGSTWSDPRSYQLSTTNLGTMGTSTPASAKPASA